MNTENPSSTQKTTNTLEEFTYFAFISYSRKDGNWAKWLHRAIESYRLPASIHKESKDKGESLPTKILPLFFDRTDITPVGTLSETLKLALRESKYLIVICSPNSGKSNWVNEEVIEFKNLGRESRIIPVIVDGSVEECYPPALSHELLGINIKENGKAGTKLRVIARLLGLKYDKLMKRAHAHHCRKYTITVALVAFLGLLMLWLLL